MRISLLPVAVLVTTALSAPQKDLTCLSQIQTATADLRGALLSWNGGIMASVPVLKNVQKIYSSLTIQSTCRISASDLSSRTMDMERQTLRAVEKLADEISDTIEVVVNLKPKIATVSVINSLPLVGIVVAQIPNSQQYLSQLPETGTQVTLMIINSFRKAGSSIAGVLVDHASPELRDEGQKLAVKIDGSFQRGINALQGI